MGSRRLHCSPWRAPREGWGIFPEELQLMETPHQSRPNLSDYSPGKGPLPKQKKKSEEEGAAERNHCLLTIDPCSHIPCASQGAREESGEGGGKVLVNVCFSLSESIFIGNKLNYFSSSQTWFVCNGHW